MNGEDDPIRYDGFGRLEVKGENDPITDLPFRLSARFTREAIDDMRKGKPRPRPSWFRRLRHELSWRIPHALRVLFYGE